MSIKKHLIKIIHSIIVCKDQLYIQLKIINKYLKRVSYRLTNIAYYN